MKTQGMAPIQQHFSRACKHQMISNTRCGHGDGVSKSTVKGKRKQTPDHFPKKEVRVTVPCEK